MSTDDSAGIRPVPQLRKTILSNKNAAMVLKSIETELGEKIHFYTHKDTSYWCEFDEKPAIVIDRRSKSFAQKYLNGGYWPHRLLFHELGHAFLDTFHYKSDKGMFRKLFGKYGGYSYGTFDSIVDTIAGNLKGTPSVTRYGRTHGQEAFAEAFSFVMAGIDDRDEKPEVVAQLAFVDWMTDCVRHKKRNWGKYKGYCAIVQCAECSKDFSLDGCRISLDIKSWEIECPYCETEIIGV